MKKISSFLDVTPDDALALVGAHGGKASHVKTIYEGIFRRWAREWRQIGPLPEPLREALAGAYLLHPLRLERTEVSALDGTARYFFQTPDGKTTSAVYLPEAGRTSLCLSSQVGCGYACGFCASGLVRFDRNLTAAEIIDQILWIAHDRQQPPTNLLFMGMGEPLANYNEVVKAIRWMSGVPGLHLGPSQISLSTSGLIPQIGRLAEDKVRVRLAISLHAVTDRVRQEIMPVSGRFGVHALVEAARAYSEKMRTAVMFEYILLEGVNNRVEDAMALSELMQGFDCRVNLIPYNPVATLPYRRPSSESVLAFQKILTERGVRVFIRKPKGLDIGSACGQLGASGA